MAGKCSGARQVDGDQARAGGDHFGGQALLGVHRRHARRDRDRFAREFAGRKAVRKGCVESLDEVINFGLSAVRRAQSCQPGRERWILSDVNLGAVLMLEIRYKRAHALIR